MKMGELIRNYRKEKKLTQEEMANRLGVTAPAVNKWENGNSMPDIALIAPICRLLDITPDILFAFHEELTTEEISLFILELNEKLKTEPFAPVFSWAKKKLEQYPDCEQLFWQTALVLDAWRKTHDIPDSKTYDEYICACYTRALESEEETLRTLAADSLFAFYTVTGEYEKAESFLSYFSKQNPERKRKQAFLYSKTNRLPEAYRAYEELLFSSYQILSMIFHSLYQLAMQEKNKERAYAFVEKQTQLAKLFEMGSYHELFCQFDFAVAKQDADAAFDLLEKLLASLPELFHCRHSFLYEHIAFQEAANISMEELWKNLLKRFEEEEPFAFLQKDARWETLFK